jgi:hypothetical protein
MIRHCAVLFINDMNNRDKIIVNRGPISAIGMGKANAKWESGANSWRLQNELSRIYREQKFTYLIITGEARKARRNYYPMFTTSIDAAVDSQREGA